MKKIWIYLFSVIILLIFVIIIVWHNNFNKQKEQIINIWIQQLCETKYKETEWEEWVKFCFEKNKSWEKEENLWTIWTIIRWCYKKSWLEEKQDDMNTNLYLSCVQLFETSIKFQWQWKLVEDVSPALDQNQEDKKTEE